MNQKDKNIIPHFEALLDWTEEGLNNATIPHTYHQYMKLKEALESVINSLSCFTPVDLPQFVEHQGNDLRIVVDNTPLDKLRLRQGKIQVPLPML